MSKVSFNIALLILFLSLIFGTIRNNIAAAGYVSSSGGIILYALNILIQKRKAHIKYCERALYKIRRWYSKMYLIQIRQEFDYCRTISNNTQVVLQYFKSNLLNELWIDDEINKFILQFDTLIADNIFSENDIDNIINTYIRFCKKYNQDLEAVISGELIDDNMQHAIHKLEVMQEEFLSLIDNANIKLDMEIERQYLLNLNGYKIKL